MDKTGTLYGVTSQGGGGKCDENSCAYVDDFGSAPRDAYNPGLGTVFSLTPPVAGHTAWTEQVVYSFAGNLVGVGPASSLLSSPDGGLYGTTARGGAAGRGTVFKLMPSGSGAGRWHRTMFYEFGRDSERDGISPMGPLHLDDSTDGGLVGTTYTSFGPDDRGAIFKLKPPSSGFGDWQETIAHYFTGSASFPLGGLNLDKATDTYYTTTSGGGEGACDLGGCGTVVALSPPSVGSGVDWRSTVLHTFGSGKDGKHPVAGMVRDAAGNFYGTTSEGGTQGMGTVFMITP
jgi:uncharacterized repeat protein (TIGR03803 family)